MQDLAPSGKTTVETADSAIHLKPWRGHSNISVVEECDDPQQTTVREQVTFKLLHAVASHPKIIQLCFEHFPLLNKSSHRFDHRESISPTWNRKCTNASSAEQITEWVVVCVKWWINICMFFKTKKNKINGYCTRYMLEKNTGSCLSA